jgi:ribosomal protein S4
VTIQHTNAQVNNTYITHTNTHITKSDAIKINKTRNIQTISQSHTNSKGHITASEYSVEKGEEIKRSLIQVLEAY